MEYMVASSAKVIERRPATASNDDSILSGTGDGRRRSVLETCLRWKRDDRRKVGFEDWDGSRL